MVYSIDLSRGVFTSKEDQYTPDQPRSIKTVTAATITLESYQTEVTINRVDGSLVGTETNPKISNTSIVGSCQLAPFIAIPAAKF